ncbi:MAG: hypothetical protein GY841_16085 [FCB group bacterium]|nr:hypothetical protein [FCB group bacterium]
MSRYNYIYEWEGDSDSKFANAVWESGKFIGNSRSTIAVGQVTFVEGDFAAHQTLLDTRNDTLARNRDKISSGLVDDCGGALGGGFCFATFAIAGDILEVVPDEPTYSGSQSLSLKLYGDGELKDTVTVYNEKPFRFETGYRAKTWEIQIESNVEIKKVDVASTMRELMGGK